MKTGFIKLCLVGFGVILSGFFLFILSDDSKTRLVILHTNSTNGILENCGCPHEPLGALEKRSAKIKEIRSSWSDVLVLDSGDILPAIEDTMKARLALKAMEIIGYDAMTIGDQEFINGPAFFKHEVLGSGLPFVSANLFWRDSHKPVTKSHLIKKIAGLKIAIIGIIAPNAVFFFPEEKGEWFQIRDYDNILEGLLKDLRKKADFIVLLSHSGYDEDRKIARKFPDIDLIVGGHSQTKLERPGKVGNTLIVQAGGNCRYLGRLDLTFNRKKKLSHYRGKLIPLTLDMPNDPRIIELIREYEKHFFGDVRPIPHIGTIPLKFGVARAEDCRECHELQYDRWQNTPHARAFEIIQERGKVYNPECLSCHTTGYGREDGFKRIDLTPGMVGVSCTECHYVDKDHHAEAVKEATCVRCHNQKNSPDFGYPEYLKKIVH
ncbi:hypothetical protein ISS37_06385 [candidate division KSB1 bacterium]|nr:hypothetical protein [candidate division KSB1 bacterium]